MHEHKCCMVVGSQVDIVIDMYEYRISLDKGLSSPKLPEGLQDRYDCHCYTVIEGMHLTIPYNCTEIYGTHKCYWGVGFPTASIVRERNLKGL